MKIGVFAPLLSHLPLRAVLEKLKTLRIDTVELGTGNYPGDAHCKLSMLDDSKALAEFRQVLADHGVTISALSCHGNPLHPNAMHVLDAKPYTNERRGGWIFRTCGQGAEWWV